MPERPGFYLPDFCRARSVLAVILIAALVAVLFTLARHGISATFWTELAQVSLFLLWAALGTAALWCAARGLLSRLDVLTGSLVALGLAMAVTALVTEGAWWLAEWSRRSAGGGASPGGTAHLLTQVRNLAVCAVAGGLWPTPAAADASRQDKSVVAPIRSSRPDIAQSLFALARGRASEPPDRWVFMASLPGPEPAAPRGQA